MVQYANPHNQQPRGNQYGGYPQQPQPQQPPYGSIANGQDGRPYQFTPQGWVPVADPRMLPPGQFPQQGQYPQQQPQYPQQYPQYQGPNQPSQMPVYGQPNQPQATVYQNPSHQAGNRFGGSSQPVEAVTEVKPTSPTRYTPAPAQTQPQGDTDMQLVSHGKTSTRKNILTVPSFKVNIRTSAFSEQNTTKSDELVVTDCLDELMEMAIEKLVNNDRNPSAMITDAVIEMVYHKANQDKYVKDLFQPDIKAIYKSFKLHVSAVNNRYDLVYLSAINDYLTTLINDLLYPILNTYPVIESFTEDFNDLLRNVRNNCSAEVEDLLIETANKILGKTHANFQLMDQLTPVDPEDQEIATDTPRALIPMPVQFICVNFLNSELGDINNLSKMLAGLEGLVEDQVAYVGTIDKTLYKAFFNDGSVMLDLLRD